MLKAKQGEFSLISLLARLFGSVLLVSAVVVNFTDNSGSSFIDKTLLNAGAPINISSLDNLSIIYGSLARVFNEDNLDFDRDLREEYLNWNKNFSNLTFERINGNKEFIVTTGNRNDDLRGINVNDNNYAIHLIYCDSYNRYCIFKVNGVPTKRLYSFKDSGDAKVNSFDFDETYKLKINSVEFDFCDNRRFCHLGFEGYHVVNISIEVKR